MKKYLLLPIFLFTIAISAVAQQDAMFSQYMFNMLAVNPAYAGSRDVISLTALHRNQWTGIPGAPVTNTFTADVPFKEERIGLGLTIVNDKIGITNNNGAYLSYAYRIKFKKKGTTFAMGLTGGVSQYSAKLSEVQTAQSGDPAFSQDSYHFLPNFGFGLYYTSDRFYVGASLPHLMNNSLSSTSRILQQGDGAVQYRHAFIMGGMVFPLNESLKLRPSTLIKYVQGSPLTIDLNCNLWIHDKVAVGLTYRTGDGPLAMVEFQISNNIRLGYAYDFPFTKLQRYTWGSHEFLLRYEFGHEKSKILTPRYF
jgi:type IX secretion system PorP/SprF family membrane protein